MRHFGATKGSVRRVPLFVVFDLDRTLLDTNAFVELIWHVLPRLGMMRHDIEALKDKELSLRGQQFDLINEVAERVSGSLDREQLAARLVETANSWPIVYEGVSGLLEDLERHDVPVAIMTYGSEFSQQIKLQTFQGSLEGKRSMPPVLIVDHQEKARWIDQNAAVAEGSGRIVPLELSGGKDIIASRIAVVDDKQPNLDTDADDIRGVLIDNQSSSGSRGMRIGELTAAGLLSDSLS